MSLGVKLGTLRRLGLPNLVRVALYRVSLRTRLHPVTRIRTGITVGDRFFAIPNRAHQISELSEYSPKRWDKCGVYFGWYERPLNGQIPDWHTNAVTGQPVPNPERPWYQIPDFDAALGDIKAVWEASRFEWVLAMAQRAMVGRQEEINRLNQWLSDWRLANPPYIGPNWKCGQEAAIRVIHMATAAHILGQDRDTPDDLLRLVQIHLRRIEPTVSYAIAQDNNHATSEAAALFIGGEWCYRHGIRNGLRWMRIGRKLLENRVRRLVEVDGSFSQYSVNYHRLFLDTLCIAELWRRWHNVEPFSESLYARARAATEWLYCLIEPQTGDAPNLGANDGARLLPLVDTDYRDYRPTVQLASALFKNSRAYPPSPDAPYEVHLRWLGVTPSQHVLPPARSVQRDQGGYAVLRRGEWFLLFRYPRFRFRPSHCDALHVDLWHGALNLLRDGGSYSYGADPAMHAYFTGTASHNTIQFDDRDQMPSLGRFLRGAWLTAHSVESVTELEDALTVAAGYTDYCGATHVRRIILDTNGVTVQDQVRGFRRKAVMRWRLVPGEWILEGNVIYNGRYSLQVASNVPIMRFELTEGLESRYYLQMTPLPVLEVEIHSPGTLTTRFGVSAS